MVLDGAELARLIGSYLWPLFRIGALFMAMPVIGSNQVPVRVRMAMAIAVTLMVAPLVPEKPDIDPFSIGAILLIVQQVLIGAAMGFALQLVFNAAITGAQVIAMQMGLGFASMVDPQNGQQVPVLGQLYLLMTTLLFLTLDGHLVAIELVAQSFQVMPIAADGITREGFRALAGWGTQLFAGALWMALPAVAALLIVNTAFGVMARAAPQLNIFVIGFPVAMIMGYIVIYLVLPTVVPQFTALLDEAFTLMRQMLGGGG